MEAGDNSPETGKAISSCDESYCTQRIEVNGMAPGGHSLRHRSLAPPCKPQLDTMRLAGLPLTGLSGLFATKKAAPLPRQITRVATMCQVMATKKTTEAATTKPCQMAL